MMSNFNPELVLKTGSFKKELKKLKNLKIFLLTNRTPYKLFKSYFKYLDYSVHLVRNNNLVEINQIISSNTINNCNLILGFGSGTTIDVAKVVSSKKKMRLIAVPTILSCNVFATNKSVITNKRRIKTIDSKIPDRVIIDKTVIKYSLIGMSDVLSIFTALFDWNLAIKHKKEKNNPFIMYLALFLLSYLRDESTQLFKKKSDGLETLAVLLLLSGYLTNLYGSGRPESGSEHMVSRAIEESKVYRRNILHGESVLLGILLCSELQGQDNEFVYHIARKLNFQRRLKDASLNEDAITKLLLRASNIRRERYSIFNTIRMTDDLARTIVNKVLYKLKND